MLAHVDRQFDSKLKIPRCFPILLGGVKKKKVLIEVSTVEYRLYVFHVTTPKKRITEKKTYNRKFVITHSYSIIKSHIIIKVLYFP